MENLKALIKKRKIVLLISVVLLFVIAIPFVKNYLEDSKRYYLLPPYFKRHTSHFGEVSLTVHIGTLSSYKGYISACDKIPKNYEDIFKPIKSDHPQCQARGMWHLKWPDSLRKDYRPWIDPWGRPYQIRFDRDKKIQMRSQGRYGWTSLDDIKAETSFTGPDFEKQVKKCDELPEDSPDCIFNWGWH